MFEPLKHILDKHGDDLQGKLSRVVKTLERIADGIDKLNAPPEALRISTFVKAGKTEMIRNEGPDTWEVLNYSTTVKGKLNLGTEGADGFVASFTANSQSKNVQMLVPPGSVIFVKNEEGATDGMVTLEVKVHEALVSPREGHTGPGSEAYERQRVENVPSGTPLDEPVIP